jgi:type II secretory pathway component HofQ
MKKVSAELREQRRLERAQAIAYARLVQARSKEAQRKTTKEVPE